MAGARAARVVGAVTAFALAAAAASALRPSGATCPDVLPAALAGDAKVAETLFKSGKQAFQKGDYDGAVTFFRKTLEEDPTLVEAAWWRAAAEEKRGDKPAALASYREYLSLLALKSAPSKEELRLKGLAEKSVDALGGGEKDLRKLDDALVASLLQFAKDNFVRDPGVSLKALASLLEVRPDHAEALKLREKLGGAPAAPAAAPDTSGPGPATGPFRDVKEWKDLLAEKTLESKAAIRYEDGLMTVDTKGGLLVRNESPLTVGTKYAYEMEYRVVEAYERGWLTGLLFASGAEEQFYSAHAMESRVELLQARARTEQNTVGNFDMPPIQLNTWHRLGVIVDGPAVQVWFDGKKVVTWREPSGKDLEGELGIFQQRCRTERRVFRAGKLD